MEYQHTMETIIVKKFYCPFCGQKLKILKEANRLTDEQKKIYYKELYPYGVPINLEVYKNKQMFKCHNCNYVICWNCIIFNKEWK